MSLNLLKDIFVYALMKIALVAFIVFFHTTFIKAQLFDSIQAHLNCNPELVFRIDSRNSFISSRKAAITGFLIGFEYDRKFSVGIGLKTLTTEIQRSKPFIIRRDGLIDSLNIQLKFKYVVSFIEYVFYRSHRWEHSLPVQIGFGNSSWEYMDANNQFLRFNNRPFVIYEPSMTTQYKFFSWASLGAGIGYRILLLRNKEIDESFNSPVYVIKLNLHWGDIYKRVFKKKQDVTV